MLSLKKTAAVGCNNRQTVWIDVVRKLSGVGVSGSSPIAKELASAPKRWIDLVPSEWVEIYGALYDESPSFELSDNEIDKIEKDVFRTYSLFTRNAARMRIDPLMNLDEYYEGLRRVLYAASHTAGGYCQGINFIAAAFLLGTGNNEKESFTILCYLLKQRNYEVLFSPKYSSLVEYMKMFEKRLKKHNKEVYNHFQLHGFSTVCYAIEWFTTMFIVTSPGDLSACSIDLVLIGMDDALIRVGLAILDCLGPKILKLSQEDLQMNFKQLVMDLDIATVLTLSFSIPVRLGQNMLDTMALNIQKNMPENGLHINTLLSSHNSTNMSCDENNNSDDDDTTARNFQVNTCHFSDYSNKGDDEIFIGPEVINKTYRNSFNMRRKKNLRQLHRENIKIKKEVFLKKLRLLIARTEFLSSDEYKMKCKNDPNNYPLKISKKSVIGYFSDDEIQLEDNSLNSSSVGAVKMIGNVLGLGLFNAFDAIPSLNMLGDKTNPIQELDNTKGIKVVVGKEIENSRMLDRIVGGIDNVVTASVWIGTLGLVGNRRVENNDHVNNRDTVTDEEYFGDIDHVGESAAGTSNEEVLEEGIFLPMDKKLKVFSDIVAHTNSLLQKDDGEGTYALESVKSLTRMRSVSPTDMPTHAPRNAFHPLPFVQPASHTPRGPAPPPAQYNRPHPRCTLQPRGHIHTHPRQGNQMSGHPQSEFEAISYTNFETKGRNSYNKSGRNKPKLLYANI